MHREEIEDENSHNFFTILFLFSPVSYLFELREVWLSYLIIYFLAKDKNVVVNWLGEVICVHLDHFVNGFTCRKNSLILDNPLTQKKRLGIGQSIIFLVTYLSNIKLC